MQIRKKKKTRGNLGKPKIHVSHFFGRKNSARYDLVNFPREGCVPVSMEVEPPLKGMDQSRDINQPLFRT